MATVLNGCGRPQPCNCERCATEELFGQEPPRCFACGLAAVAYWSGQVQTVAVCRTCALDLLPKFLADALIGSDPQCGIVAQVEGEVKHAIDKTFWGAVLVALTRADRRRKRAAAGRRAA